MSQNSALVTGGGGFIGVNLARTLIAANWRVSAFDDFSTGMFGDCERVGYDKVIVGDIRDPEAIRRAAMGHSHIVHLAAHTNVVESVEDPVTDLKVNVEGTMNALIAARDAGVSRFVFASSNAPLGDVDPPSHEMVVPRPLSPYGASKLAGEALCSAFAGSYGLGTVALRFSNVYGPYSYHKGSVVATFMRQISNGEKLVVYGSGDQTRDFVYVDDLCRGIHLAMESTGIGEVFHLGSGVEVSVNGLVDELRHIFPNREIEVEKRPARPGEIDRNYSDIGKARRELGFEPRTKLLEGLKRTRTWFEQEELRP